MYLPQILWASFENKTVTLKSNCNGSIYKGWLE